MTNAHYPDILEALLEARGLSGEEAESFLSPDYSTLHDPLLLPDMEKARDRVIEAIQNKEHIVVFGDYDCDGVSATVVMSDLFKLIGYENVSFYIPHRHDEGFGLNHDAVDEILARGAKLMITVDCGTADLAEVERAQEAGMDVIVTDHHESSAAGLPKAYAVVNPKRKDSKYPFKELCGAGVAYKLMQAVLAKERFGTKEGMEKWSLDMVAIATLSDMVPLVGENRVLASFGLDVLRKAHRPGLRILFNKLRIEQRYANEDDIAFMITPRINAASRMGVPMDAFKLLSAENVSEASALADHLEEINQERKLLVARIVKDAKAHVGKRSELGAVIVVGNPEWKPAIMGLVANSLVEEYERPAFVWGRDNDGVIKGSCRSYNGYNLADLMNSASDAFIDFGGHAGAGGFSASLEQIGLLEERLSSALEALSAGDVAEDQHISVSLSSMGERLWDTVAPFAPFGMGNPKPVFKISCEVNEIRKFGKKNEHLELVLADESGNSVKAISFFASPETYQLTNYPTSRTILANLEKSYFRNRPELRLRIVDIIN